MKIILAVAAALLASPVFALNWSGFKTRRSRV